MNDAVSDKGARVRCGRRWWQFGGWFEPLPAPDPAVLRRKMIRSVALSVLSAACFVGVSRSGRDPDLALFAAVLFVALLVIVWCEKVRFPQKPYGHAAYGCGLGVLVVGIVLTGTKYALAGAGMTLCAAAALLLIVWRYAVARVPSASSRFDKLSRAVMRFFGDAVKAVTLLAVLLYLLFLLSTPFRPLAVPPPPAEWVARYVPTLREPTSDGLAHRMCMGFSNPTELREFGVTNAITVPGWHTRWEAFCGEQLTDGDSGESLRSRFYYRARTAFWDQAMAGSGADEALDGLLPAVEAFADAAADGVPGRLPLHNDNPSVTWLPPGQPLLAILHMEAVRRADRGEMKAAIVAIQRQINICEYLLRGETLIDRLVGVLMARRTAQMVLRLAGTADGLNPANALTLEKVLATAGARMPAMTAAIHSESRNYQMPIVTYLYRDDVRWSLVRRMIGLDSSGAGLLDSEFGDPLHRWPAVSLVLGLSPLAGNDRSGVLRSVEHGGLWTTVLAGATLDPNGPDLDLLESQAAQAMKLSILKRGWFAISLYPDYSRFVENDAAARAHFAAARTALMLSAFRHAEGREAGSLAEVEARFNWEAPMQPLTERPIAYIRLAAPEGAVPGASAYALACWADGRAVKSGGGTVWLVVRNPAFGDLPFRVYHWLALNPALVSNTVVVEAAKPPADHGDDEPRPALCIAPGLFMADPAGWKSAEVSMRETGFNW